jgi:tetratricopeptide (TPR) repeat protein
MGATLMSNAQQHLSQLEASGLLRLAATLPELEYLFRHALIQDAAYSSLLKSDRKQLHRRVGETLEATYPSRLEELAPVLAAHFAEAGEEARAFRYFTLAGDAAARVYANAEAVTHYSQGIALAKRATSSGMDEGEDGVGLSNLFSKRGRALELSAQYETALANYREMEEIGQARGDRAMHLAALMQCATLHSTSTPLYNFAQGEALGQQAVQLAQALGDRAAEAKILWNLINLHRFSGNMPRALECGERALAVAREYHLREQLAFILNDMTHIYMSSGRPQPGWVALRESAALWRELGNQPMLADSLGNAALYLSMAGQYDEAMSASDEAFAVSQAIHNTWGQSYSRSFVGRAYWDRGEIGRAIEIMETAIHYGELSGFIVAQIQTRSNLAELYGALGAVETGLALNEVAAEFARTRMPVFHAYTLSITSALHYLRGDLNLAQRALETIEDSSQLSSHPAVRFAVGAARSRLLIAQGHYAEALKLFVQLEPGLRTSDFKPFLVAMLYERGVVHLKLGDWPAAQTALNEARAQAEAFASRWMLWRIFAALADLEAQRGHSAEAASLRAQAQTVIQFIADHCPLELRASFLNLKEVKTLTGGQGD